VISTLTAASGGTLGCDQLISRIAGALGLRGLLHRAGFLYHRVNTLMHWMADER
jgi:hypothetical protein